MEREKVRGRGQMCNRDRFGSLAEGVLRWELYADRHRRVHNSVVCPACVTSQQGPDISADITCELAQQPSHKKHWALWRNSDRTSLRRMLRDNRVQNTPS